jgi:hypothetical protein
MSIGGGYGVGSLEYASLININGPVTDVEIYATIARNIAAGITAWTKITAFNGLTPAILSIPWQPPFQEFDSPVPDPVDYPPVAYVGAAPF